MINSKNLKVRRGSRRATGSTEKIGVRPKESFLVNQIDVDTHERIASVEMTDRTPLESHS